MRKTFCDKCGKEITTDVEWVFNHELCSKCAEAVDIFITHPSGPSTIDVQPVKHGRWIIEDDVEHFTAVCSECGRAEDSKDIKDMPYCHCGARMDSDKANNVRNLTDEETEIYESWIDHEAKDTGVNIMDSDTE